MHIIIKKILMNYNQLTMLFKKIQEKIYEYLKEKEKIDK